MDGISTSRNCGPHAACLQQAGKAFVVRYLSRTTKLVEKRLTAAEATRLAERGLGLVTVYQDNARELADFGHARGLLDGRSAFDGARQVGQPMGSAIYFAVDTDFSVDDIEAVVLPYFEGVRSALLHAAGGADGYRIGVYGSGLSCQIVRENHALASLSWLAMARRWRFSDSYTTWSMRQSGPTGALCGLGLQWEHNEGREDFGMFQPVIAAAEPPPGPELVVTAPELFLRSVPSTQGNVPIARLKEGQRVRVLASAEPPWLQVGVRLGGSEAVGFASGRFLEPPAVSVPADVATPQVAGPDGPSALPAAHFREHDLQSRRASAHKRAQPLGEDARPARDATLSQEVRVAQLDAIVDWLAVEASLRYQRDAQTYCNIYAADFCYLAQVYLPRVWWKSQALVQLAAGASLPVRYDVTVREMRADDLLAWLLEFGAAFGWQRVTDLSALQAAANAGGIGLICADRREPGPGHISVVVPESAAVRARRDADGDVVSPVQSQAGAQNFRRNTSADWWNDAIYREHVFFMHA